jgi:hypothetical protein
MTASSSSIAFATALGTAFGPRYAVTTPGSRERPIARREMARAIVGRLIRRSVSPALPHIAVGSGLGVSPPGE